MTDTLADYAARGTAILPHPWNLLALAVAATLAALLLHWVVFRLLRRVVGRTRSEADEMLVRRLAMPTRFALVALALVLTAREIPAFETVWERVAGFVMPAVIGWIALAILQALIEAMKLRADISVEDNLSARRQRTKLTMLSRIATFIIIFVTVGLVLLSIPGVRDIGVTLVASAGLAGLAVG
ncbi:MAG TPA: hypothetical protein DD795_04175, partial [Erythrobacter sp.]|nr:hypothetical protein [Erythrobacter sp.]